MFCSPVLPHTVPASLTRDRVPSDGIIPLRGRAVKRSAGIVQGQGHFMRIGIPKHFLPTPWSPPVPSPPYAAVSSPTAFSAWDVTPLQAPDAAGLSLQAARLLPAVCGPAHGPDRGAPGRVHDSLGPDAPSCGALGARQAPLAKGGHQRWRTARGRGEKGCWISYTCIIYRAMDMLLWPPQAEATLAPAA
jgi:hypothetical protein